MLNTDEDAVICDLAETYHIYDYGSLPLKTVATLVYGLGADSRIKRKMRGEEFTISEFLLMTIADILSIMCWLNTTDGQKGINRPKLFTEQIKKKNDTLVFDSIDDFEKARQALINK